MLKELLMEIHGADYVSKVALAGKLDQPLSLIEDGLAQLVRMGYLLEDQGLLGCDLPCGRCPYGSMCTKVPLKTLAITAKGQEFLAAHA